jgi:hypothetical protein
MNGNGIACGRMQQPRAPGAVASPRSLDRVPGRRQLARLALLAFATCTTLAFTRPAASADPVTGDGEFTSKGFTMPVSSAIAFRGKSTLDQADVIVVAISNGSFRDEWIGSFHDRKRAIEQRFKDRDTAVVYLEFKPDGAYRGHQFHFKSGNGCGYCGGNMGVTSTVKVAGGKIAGTLKLKDGDKVANVKIDTKILSDDHGAPLPANGGAPGEAYLAYHKALVANDPKALRPTLSKENGKYLDDAIKRGKTAAGMKLFTKDHPDESVKIVRGWSKGDQAVLLISGETKILRLVGEAVMVREGGKWLVDEELTELAPQK